jgi:hypothetical protein
MKKFKKIRPLLKKDIDIINILIDEAQKRGNYKCDYYIDKLNSTFVEVKAYYENIGCRVQRLGTSYSFSIYWTGTENIRKRPKKMVNY